MDYDKIFEKHLVVLTGTARTGTSIVGKLVGSFQNVYYLFEPVVFQKILVYMYQGILPYEQGKQLLHTILFEDFFLNIMQGRYVNYNKGEESYIGNYKDLDKVKNRAHHLPRKKDVMHFLNRGSYCFLIKFPNIQPLMKTIDMVFPGVQFVITERQQKDVIGSSIRRGFYTEQSISTDQWLLDDVEGFFKLNHTGRCKHIYNILQGVQDEYVSNHRNVTTVLLEQLTSNAESTIQKLEGVLDLKRTEKTQDIVESINTYNQLIYENELD